MSKPSKKHTKVKEKSHLKRNTESNSNLLFTNSRTKKSNKNGANSLTSQKLNAPLEREACSNLKKNQELETEHLFLSEERVTNKKNIQKFQKPISTKNSKSFNIDCAESHPPSFSKTCNYKKDNSTVQGNDLSPIHSRRLGRSISTPDMSYEDNERHSAYFREKFRFVIHVLRSALLETLNDIHVLREKVSSHLSLFPLEKCKARSDSSLTTKHGVNGVQSTRKYFPTLHTLSSVIQSTYTTEDDTLSSTYTIDSQINKSLVNTILDESDSKSLTTINSAETVRCLELHHHEIQNKDSQLLQSSNENCTSNHSREENEDTGTGNNITLANEASENVNEPETKDQKVISLITHIAERPSKEKRTSISSFTQNLNKDTHSCDMSEKMNYSPETSRSIEPPRKKICYDPPQATTSRYYLMTNNIDPLRQKINNTPECCSTTIRHRNQHNEHNCSPCTMANRQTGQKALARKTLRFSDKEFETSEIDETLSENISQIKTDIVIPDLNQHSNTEFLFQSSSIDPKTDLQKCYFGASTVINPGSETVLRVPNRNMFQDTLANSCQSSQSVHALPSPLAQSNLLAVKAPCKTFLVTDLQPAVNSSLIPTSVVVHLRSAALPTSREVFRKPTFKRKLDSPSETTHFITESDSTGQNIHLRQKNVKDHLYMENIKKYAPIAGQKPAHGSFSNRKLFPFQPDLSFHDTTSSNGSFIISHDATTASDSVISKINSSHHGQPIIENFNTDCIRIMSGKSQFLRKASLIDEQGCNTSPMLETITIHSTAERPFSHQSGHTLRGPQITKSSAYPEAQNISATSHNPESFPGLDWSRIQESMTHRGIQMSPRTTQDDSGSLSNSMKLPEYIEEARANQSQYHKNPLPDDSMNGMKNSYSREYPLDTLEKSSTNRISDTILLHNPLRDCASVEDMSFFQDGKNGKKPEIEHASLLSETEEKQLEDKNGSLIKEHSSHNHSNSKNNTINSKNISPMLSSTMKSPFIDSFRTGNSREEEKTYTCENFSAHLQQQTSITKRTFRPHLIGDHVDQTHYVKASMPLFPRPLHFTEESKFPVTQEIPYRFVSDSKCNVSSQDVSNAASQPNKPRLEENQVFPTIRVDHEYLSQLKAIHSGTTFICGAAQCSANNEREGPAHTFSRSNTNDDQSQSTYERTPDFQGMPKFVYGSTPVSTPQTPSICVCPNLCTLGKRDDTVNKSASTTEQKVYERKVLKARRRISQSTSSHSTISLETKLSSHQFLEPIIEADGNPSDTCYSTTGNKQCFALSNDYLAKPNEMDSSHAYILENSSNTGTSMKFTPFHQQFNTEDYIRQNILAGGTTRYNPMNVKQRAPQTEERRSFKSISVPSLNEKKEPDQMFGYKNYICKINEGKSYVKVNNPKIYTPSTPQFHILNSKNSGNMIFERPPNTPKISMNNNMTSKTYMGTRKGIPYGHIQSSVYDTQTNENFFILIPSRKGLSVPSLRNKPNNLNNKNHSFQLTLTPSPICRKSCLQKKDHVHTSTGVQSAGTTDDFPSSDTFPPNDSPAQQGRSNFCQHVQNSSTKLLGKANRTFTKYITQLDKAKETSFPLKNKNTSKTKQNVTQNIQPTASFKAPFYQNKVQCKEKLDKQVEQPPKIKKVASTFSPKTVPSSLNNRKGIFPQDYSRLKHGIDTLMNHYKMSQVLCSENNTSCMKPQLGDIASSDVTFNQPLSSVSSIGNKCCDPMKEYKSNNLLETQLGRFEKHNSCEYTSGEHKVKKMENSKSLLSVTEYDFPQYQQEESFLSQTSDSKLIENKWVIHEPFSLHSLLHL